jgi:hypothetical protein
MARSPIRGLDPHVETAEASQGASVEANSAEADVIARGAAPSEDAVSSEPPAEDKAPEPEAKAEAPASPATPEGGRAPLKKPLGLSLRKPMAEAKAASSPEAAPAPKPKPRTSIEEAIELALASASTAVDSAQEIQRLRKELQMVADATRRSDRTLFAATMIVVVAASLGLTGALIFYGRSFNDFAPVARVNRDALLTFAGEVNGLAESSQRIADAVKVSEAALSAANAQTQEIRKAIQGFTAAQNALTPKIPPATAYDKPISALKQSLDELAASSNSINSRLIEMQQAQLARHRAPTPPVEAPRVEPPKAPPKPAPSGTSERDSLIRYP